MDGLALLVIAALGAWIAYRQLVTARTKLQLDLYEKRLPVLQAARVFLSAIATKGTMTDEALIAFTRAIGNARFLFDEELDGYLAGCFGELGIDATHALKLSPFTKRVRRAAARELGGRDLNLRPLGVNEVLTPPWPKADVADVSEESKPVADTQPPPLTSAPNVPIMFRF